MQNLKDIILKCTPKKLKEAIVHEYKIRSFDSDKGFHKISYSQQGEDLALNRFFENKKRGFYVDVGAYHPINFSNTHLFYRMGWNGINIEPNPDVYSQFLALRERDINLNFAIGSSDEELFYYRFNYAGVNTLDKAHAESWVQKDGFILEDKVPIKTYPLEQVLSKYMTKGTEIDFMTVDVEGWDLEVLSSNDWRKFRPKILVIEEEINSAESFTNSKLLRYLEDKGYSVWNVCSGSILLKDNNIGFGLV